MPIIGTCLAVRMDALDERQAKINHSQTLARLAERGGLSPCEALALLLRQAWRPARNGVSDAQLLAELDLELKRREARATTGDRSDG